jgi:hypothetical protein
VACLWRRSPRSRSRDGISARYAILAAPGYYLLLAHTIANENARSARVLIVVYLLVLGISIWNFATSPTHTHYREDWRQIARTLQVRGRPGDVYLNYLCDAEKFTTYAYPILDAYWNSHRPVTLVDLPVQMVNHRGGVAFVAVVDRHGEFNPRGLRALRAVLATRRGLHRLSGPEQFGSAVQLYTFW